MRRFVRVCVRLRERYSGEPSDNKFGHVCSVRKSRQKKGSRHVYFPSSPSFKKSSRIPTGKMLAVMDSYIIQSSTASCIRKVKSK